MKTSVVLVCLLVAVAAKPQGFGPFFPIGGGSGGASANSHQGQSAGIFGNSQVQSSSVQAGGSAHGGGSSQNAASSNIGQSIGPFGTHQFANNQAISNQSG